MSLASFAVGKWPKLFLGLSLLYVHATLAAKDDRVNIDPNKESVLIAIGGIDMDIPLGYFYEKTIWAKGQWPKPPVGRTAVREQVVIDVRFDGMMPWTPETAADFRGGGQKTTRLTIAANYPAQWFQNWLRASPRLLETQPKYVVPGLRPYRVDNRPQVFYLTNETSLTTRFLIECDERPVFLKCGVKFSYTSSLVVLYQIPVKDIERWDVIHSDVLKLLNSFQAKKGD